MGDQRITVTRYAILIGIDAYPDRPLQGCVRDVQTIKTYLEGVVGSVQLQIFTATKSTNPESTNLSEDPILLPTYHNVTSALEKTTTMAKAGDVVYIHYSGHGTRGAPSSEFSNKSTGDLALVLLNDGKENDVRYLWGPRLALSLKAMVDKGLVVTLVLDCCFSASLYRRDDPSVRSLLYSPEIDSKFPLDLEKGTEDGAGGLASRDASMLPNWLINPDGYAILVACGPHEEALERKFDGQTHGILSYFLHRTLKECGGLGKKHKNIYDHLRANFRDSAPQQNPVLYGNTSQGFFLHTNSEITIPTVPITEKRDGSLELQAGRAHGVSDGDRFAMFPLGSAESNSGLRGDLVIAKVAQARALTSKLELLDTTSIRVQTGWIAKSLTRLSLHRFPIRLASDILHQDEWLTALKEQPLNVFIDVDNQPFSFHVVLNSNKEYEILDESDQRIINLPTMPQAESDASHICKIIEHLARFKLVRELADNVENPFRALFSVQIISRSGDIFGPGRWIEVEEDKEAKFMFELQVENKGNKSIYVYVYDMGTCWQIENILRGSYEVVPSKNSGQGFTGALKKKLKTMVPAEVRERGYRQCEDIIKVFITSQPTSFDSLELPKLGESVKRSATSRAGREEGDSSEEWAALNFLIRTSAK
ncbi:putative caspase [Leptodontidium sp. MPI-SDFR-AT-0119]|nr:putative caspase [Leptodontidium sp. MPI-SDFR-AT-0119]